ncbi:MAG: hypothetical protein M1820_001689 [Bogoriella megaspora]|nr:MAG: hypothetical protein M1820_001689 [Bogoriella megaspora]
MSKKNSTDVKLHLPNGNPSQSPPPNPSTGTPSGFKAFVLPYLELMRLDRPNGYWYFWFPHVCGTLLASIQYQMHPLNVLSSNLLLLWGVLIMRGATCTWNDTCDADYDRQVSRCRHRPIARGAVSITQASIFTLAQTALCIGTLTVMPPLCALYSIPAVVGWFAYPLAKRVTYYPQVVLGFPMAWGVYMGAAAVGADPLHLKPLHDTIRSLLLGSPDASADQFRSALVQIAPDPATTALYMGNVLWTLCYELVYSHQDAAEDAAAGVKNLILLYYNRDPDALPSERFGTKPLFAKIAACIVLLLAMTGYLGQLDLIWEIFGVAGCAIGLGIMIATVKLEDPGSCAWWFKVGNAKYVGGAMVGGLVGAYTMQWMGPL